ncbi:hypothetical protein SprV_0501886400 [Sparganum proliferum]
MSLMMDLSENPKRQANKFLVPVVASSSSPYQSGEWSGGKQEEEEERECSFDVDCFDLDQVDQVGSPVRTPGDALCPFCRPRCPSTFSHEDFQNECLDELNEQQSQFSVTTTSSASMKNVVSNNVHLTIPTSTQPLICLINKQQHGPCSTTDTNPSGWRKWHFPLSLDCLTCVSHASTEKVSAGIPSSHCDFVGESAGSVPYEQKRSAALNIMGTEDGEEFLGHDVQPCARWTQGPPYGMKYTSELSADDLV